MIKPLCDLFDVGDVRILLVALEALEAILKSATDSSKLVQLIDEAEGIDKLESLQEHENQVTFNICLILLSNNNYDTDISTGSI